MSSSLKRAATELKRGNPVIFPTDTVVGLGVAVAYCESPAVLARLKGRPANKPIAWLVGGPEALRVYGKGVSQAVFDAVSAKWPGAFTAIVNAGPDVPTAFASSKGTLGLRMPASPIALALIREVGCPLATTSANLAGQAPPKSLADVPAELLRAALSLESCEQGTGTASCVVDFTADPPVMLR